MKDHAVVGTILLVFVEAPIGRLYMDFDAPDPQYVGDRNAGFGEIRAGIGIPLAGADNGKSIFSSVASPFFSKYWKRQIKLSKSSFMDSVIKILAIKALISLPKPD
jgi:hypothetical protein